MALATAAAGARWIVAAAAAVAACGPGDRRAAAPVAAASAHPAPAPDAPDRYVPDDPPARCERDLREAARRALDRGDFDDAIALLKCAHELDPRPEHLFNLGQVHRMRGDRRAAVYYFQRYLDERPDAPNRADVEQTIQELSDPAD
jgi:tetratricopeptide (TPR) repeat protein